MANILQVSSSPITPDPSINQRISQDPSIKNPVSPGTVNGPMVKMPGKPIPPREKADFPEWISKETMLPF